MNLQFFKDCSSLDEVKQLYRKLAFQHHPDKGGNAETFKALSNEYEYISKYFAVYGDKPGAGTNKDHTNKRPTAEETNNTIFENEKYKAAIDAVIFLDGLIIEVVGSWIWITGPKTYAHREAIKTAGYFFASTKKAWYFRTEENKVIRGKKGQTLEEIKNKYGSSQVNNSRSYIAA